MHMYLKEKACSQCNAAAGTWKHSMHMYLKEKACSQCNAAAGANCNVLCPL